MILTGAADELIRGYRLVVSSNASEKEPGVSRPDSSDDILEYYGCVERQLGSAGVGPSKEKCASLCFDSSGSLLAAQSSGKIVEVC
jgi:hypothetical protein